MKREVSKKTIRAAVRGSVPAAKLKKAKIVTSSAKYGVNSATGFTNYADDRKTVEKLGVPSTDDSMGIVVRGHETRHATFHKPSRKKPLTPQEGLATQFVDDANVESKPVPETRGSVAYARDHLAMAFRDLRNIVKSDCSSIDIRNHRLGMALRVLAMLRNYGSVRDYESEKSSQRIRHARNKGLVKLREAIGAPLYKALINVNSLAYSDHNRNKAISALTLLMEQFEEVDDEIVELEIPRSEEGDLIMPVHGTAEDGKMIIRQLLPRSTPCAKERQISVQHAPDGVGINTARYVNAIVSGESHGLFHRRLRRKLGGTVVIDASGSMHANARNLRKICEMVPQATVAYYSGTDCGRADGELVVYAYNGMRFSGELPEDSLHGGNAVDLPAVQWLMAHGEPWTLISDLQFCGGNIGSETTALAIVDRERKRGRMTVHASLDAAYEAFGGKGMLPDGEKAEKAAYDKMMREAAEKAAKEAEVLAAAEAKVKADAAARKAKAK